MSEIPTKPKCENCKLYNNFWGCTIFPHCIYTNEKVMEIYRKEVDKNDI